MYETIISCIVFISQHLKSSIFQMKYIVHHKGKKVNKLLIMLRTVAD